jgi:cation diffusion facilitator CzcD-associated flavoprotein CzcO
MWYGATEKRLWGGAVYRPGSPIHTASEQAARHYIDKVLADRPDLAEAVTPSYPFWGKRVIFSSDFYPALKHPNVELVPRAVASVTAGGVVDVDGVTRKADVLVLATGFQPTNYLAHLEVVGRTGASIQKYWDGEPRAFLGVTVPTFPNFYMLYGPGTNGGEIALNLRNQAAYARRAVKRMIREGVTAIEVKRSWADPYHAWLQSKMDDTAWAVSNNYFTTNAGKVVTQWPYSALDYGALLKTLGPLSETARRRNPPTDVLAAFHPS